jgi:hypothetical protein
MLSTPKLVKICYFSFWNISTVDQCNQPSHIIHLQKTELTWMSCLALILTGWLPDLSILITACQDQSNMKPPSLLLGCNWISEGSCTMWAIQLTTLSDLHVLVNFIVSHIHNMLCHCRLLCMFLAPCLYCTACLSQIHLTALTWDAVYAVCF